MRVRDEEDVYVRGDENSGVRQKSGPAEKVWRGPAGSKFKNMW